MAKDSNKKPLTPTAIESFSSTSDNQPIVMTLEMHKKSTENLVQIGGTIENLTVSEGKPKLDEHKQPLYDEQTGQPLTWNDSFYADFSFRGGIMSVRISSNQFGNLKVGTTYQLIGRIIMRTPSIGRGYATVELIRFDELF